MKNSIILVVMIMYIIKTITVQKIIFMRFIYFIVSFLVFSKKCIRIRAFRKRFNPLRQISISDLMIKIKNHIRNKANNSSIKYITKNSHNNTSKQSNAKKKRRSKFMFSYLSFHFIHLITLQPILAFWHKLSYIASINNGADIWCKLCKFNIMR